MFDPLSNCNTHDLIECKCDGRGKPYFDTNEEKELEEEIENINGTSIAVHELENVCIISNVSTFILIITFRKRKFTTIFVLEFGG